MRIDLSELMNRRVDRLDFDYTFDPEHTSVQCVALPDDVEIPEGGIHVVGTVSDTLDCMTLRAVVTAHYKTACARCLDEIERDLEFPIERTIMTDRIASVCDDVDEDGEWNGELDDVLYVNDAAVIPDADIIEELVLELPMLSLCSEDCPGLCPKCGKRLRDGDCGCKEKKEIDPRLAILQKLLDKQE